MNVRLVTLITCVVRISKKMARQADLVEQLKPLVDKTIAALSKTKFRQDPIGGPRYSRATSIISSAYKRHGTILEEAVLRRLQHCPHLTVWSDDEFLVSDQAQILSSKVSAMNPEGYQDILKTQVPYKEKDIERKLQIDLIVFDERFNTLRSYEIKRGNGYFDSGKKRSILRDLLCAHVLLKSYGEHKGFAIDNAEAKIIFYYGVRSLPKPLSLVSNELDEHFQFEVRKEVERVNAYFRKQLHRLLEEG